LRAIFRHIEKESTSSDLAAAFIADLDRKARSLAESGFSGVSRGYIASDLTAFPYKERCFYFRLHQERLVVVRVLHAKQDVAPEQFKD
jgi:toxin ParE1/3/4